MGNSSSTPSSIDISRAKLPHVPRELEFRSWTIDLAIQQQSAILASSTDEETKRLTRLVLEELARRRAQCDQDIKYFEGAHI